MASGHIKLRNKYARVVGTGDNFFALVEYYDRPNYACKNALGTIAQNNSSPDKNMIDGNLESDSAPRMEHDTINSNPVNRTINNKPNNNSIKTRKFVR